MTEDLSRPRRAGRTGGSSRRVRDERGVGLGLWACGLLLCSLAFAAVIVMGLFQVVQHRAEGAADLVALTAARAQDRGTQVACEAARRAAEAGGVALISCAVHGDAMAFAVTVEVTADARAPLGIPLTAQARAHAGVDHRGA